MQSGHILFIDDDDDDLFFYLEAIKALPAVVKTDTINNPVQALSSLYTGKINPDLIFVDLNMPLLKGQDFLRVIKKRKALKHIPVVVLSTSNDPETIRDVKMLGALEYVVKPFTLEAMCARFIKIFSRRDTLAMTIGV